MWSKQTIHPTASELDQAVTKGNLEEMKVKRFQNNGTSASSTNSVWPKTKVGNAAQAAQPLIEENEVIPEGLTEGADILNSLQIAHESQLNLLGNNIQLLVRKYVFKLQGNTGRPGLLYLDLMPHFGHLSQLSDIQSAVMIMAQKQAVELTPDGHDYKASWLSDLGTSYQYRFRCLGQLSDIESAIVAYKQAVEITPDGHDNKAVRLNNLAHSHQSRFSRLGQLSDIESAVLAQKHAVELTPDGHAKKVAQLNDLGNFYHLQFGYLGQLSDIENAIVAQKQAVELTPDGHASKAAFFNDLGNSYESRFGHLGQLSDLESAIRVKKQAVELIPDSHVNKAAALSNLGASYGIRFDRLGQLSDIESAIGAQKQAAELMPDDHANKAALLSNLGLSYQVRFLHFDQLNDIESAILALKQAVEATSDDHVNKGSMLDNLGSSYWSRFGHLGKLSDIESAIAAQKQAVELTPDGHAKKAIFLANLGHSYQSRFGRLGQLTDIESAIMAAKQAVESTPAGHNNRAALLNDLGDYYRSRFDCLGKSIDIESAIMAQKQAVELTPNDHAHKAARLNHLGISYNHRFAMSGKLSDIDSAIMVQKQAVELIHDDHAHKAVMLNNLGDSYLSRFHHLSQLSDIESAIMAQKQAIQLTPDNHVNKAAALIHLGRSYQSRFNYLGQLSDIESAITAHKQAVELTPDGHASKAAWLNVLSKSYQSRFGYLQELSDIESAVKIMKKAVELTSDSHASKAAFLNNLGTCYAFRFDHLGQPSDIESAIMTQKQAVEVTPNGHANKAVFLGGLGSSYHSRYARLGHPNDIESAIVALKQTVDLTPDNHSDKAVALNSLGNSYCIRFSCLGQVSDIENAIVSHKQAAELAPDGHANKAVWLNNLGISYQSRFGHSKDPCDIDLALSAYRNASLQTSGIAQVRLKASISWAKLHLYPESALVAYERMFDLIPQAVWLGQTVNHRFQELPLIGTAINAAAAAAIIAGDLPLAVEWLEEGRSIIWGQILQLRSPLDALSAYHPEVAKQLNIVCQALESAGRLSVDSVDSRHQSIADESQTHHTRALEYESLLQEIRSLQGFESFFKPKKFSELASAATHGPVVIVNVHSTRCDALVLCKSKDLILVPLPMFSLDQAQRLHLQLLSSLQATGVRIQRNDNHALRLGPSLGNVQVDHFATILSILWSNIVEPILSSIKHVLQEQYVQDLLPHITWCATGPLTLLPLHAAGIYAGTRQTNISKFAVSSYTTTLRALIDSISKHEQNQAHSEVCRVLIVSQPDTPGYPCLPGTVEEAKAILKYTSIKHACHLTRDKATTQTILNEMSKYDVIHFACHGIQDLQDPLESAFALYDQKLTLKALMGVSLKNVQLAVLSACETATGDEKLPEEAVHLAAGMLVVGYPSVIATLWSIGDNEAPLIANEFYARLMSRDSAGGNKVKMSPAYALHEATKSLREEVGEMNFVKWVPFVHFGV